VAPFIRVAFSQTSRIGPDLIDISNCHNKCYPGFVRKNHIQGRALVMIMLQGNPEHNMEHNAHDGVLGGGGHDAYYCRMHACDSLT